MASPEQQPEAEAKIPLLLFSPLTALLTLHMAIKLFQETTEAGKKMLFLHTGGVSELL